MGAVPEPVVLHRSAQRYQYMSQLDTLPLVSPHLLEGTRKCVRMQQDVLPTFLSAECSGLLLLYLLSDMWVKLLDHKRNGRNRPQQTLTDADYVFQLIRFLPS